MANICTINLELRCDNPESTKQLQQHLEQLHAEATFNNRGLYIDGSRAMFDLCFTTSDRGFDIFGWVKWGFCDEEVVALLTYLLERFPVTYMKLDYDECGCQLYGYYEFANGQLYDVSVSEEDFPDYVDGCDEEFYTYLDHVLEQSPNVRFINHEKGE